MPRRAEARIQMHEQRTGTWRPRFRFTYERICRMTAPSLRHPLGAAIGLVATKFMIQPRYGERLKEWSRVHPIFFGLKGAMHRWLKSCAKPLLAVECYSESNRWDDFFDKRLRRAAF